MTTKTEGNVRQVLVPTRLAFSIIILVILLVVGGISYFLYSKYFSFPKGDETQQLIMKVGKLIELPSDETPTVSKVTDKLKSQPFFANAQAEDRILTYSKAKKAILYRPKTNKIVDISSQIEASDSSKTKSSPSPAKSVEVKIAILNGTKTKGLAAKTEKDLTAAFTQVKVVEKGNAENDQVKTIVVVLEPTAKKIAEDIAKNLKAEVTSLPKGETQPEGASILVILGESAL